MESPAFYWYISDNILPKQVKLEYLCLSNSENLRQDFTIIFIIHVECGYIMHTRKNTLSDSLSKAGLLLEFTLFGNKRKNSCCNRSRVILVSYITIMSYVLVVKLNKESTTREGNNAPQWSS